MSETCEPEVLERSIARTRQWINEDLLEPAVR
jgi:hypothetical protein